MSEQPLYKFRFEFSVGDRMAKALKVSRVAVQEMADYLEVDRNTVSRWINNRGEPSIKTVKLWALRTGAPVQWLIDGTTPPPSGDGVPVRLEGFEPPTF